MVIIQHNVLMNHHDALVLSLLNAILSLFFSVITSVCLI